jgi:hypothetical protein
MAEETPVTYVIHRYQRADNLVIQLKTGVCQKLVECQSKPSGHEWGAWLVGSLNCTEGKTEELPGRAKPEADCIVNAPLEL